MIEHIRVNVMARVFNVTRGDDFIHILTSDQGIERRMKDGIEYSIETIADDYYKYKDIFTAPGALSSEIQQNILNGVSLYRLISMLDQEIVRLYERPPLMFETIGIRCLKCSSFETDTELLQLSSLDEAKVQRVTCRECAYVSG